MNNNLITLENFYMFIEEKIFSTFYSTYLESKIDYSFDISCFESSLKSYTKIDFSEVTLDISKGIIINDTSFQIIKRGLLKESMSCMMAFYVISICTPAHAYYEHFKEYNNYCINNFGYSINENWSLYYDGQKSKSLAYLFLYSWYSVYIIKTKNESGNLKYLEFCLKNHNTKDLDFKKNLHMLYELLINEI